MAWVGHVGIDATVGTVGAAATLGGGIHLPQQASIHTKDVQAYKGECARASPPQLNCTEILLSG